MKVLGLDVGKKRIGVAISDPLGITAQPHSHIKRTSTAKVASEVVALASELKAERIVVGMPFNMDGSIGESGRMVLKFIEALKDVSTLPIEQWDERLSSVAVNRVLIEADVSRSGRKGVVDKLAAAYILQGYLDSLNKSAEA